MDRSATVELDRLQSLFEEQRCRFYERLHSFADNDEPEPLEAWIPRTAVSGYSRNDIIAIGVQESTYKPK